MSKWGRGLFNKTCLTCVIITTLKCVLYAITLLIQLFFSVDATDRMDRFLAYRSAIGRRTTVSAENTKSKKTSPEEEDIYVNYSRFFFF